MANQILEPGLVPGSSDAGADDAARYLAELGQRVREARARRGLTRRLLARHSGVSERYLAELEAGRGNVSIGRLRQIAQAMRVPLHELVREGPEPPADLALIAEHLARLSADELREARLLLNERFDEAPRTRRPIALIGLRGAGKTTLGRALAERLELVFIELDREVEVEAGLSLAEIFDLLGPGAFRRLERQTLDRVLAAHDEAVIATGGGLVSEPATYERLLSRCFTVWLRADPDDHMARVLAQGDERPMADNAGAMDDLKRILVGRDRLYRQADASVMTSARPPRHCLDELATLCRNRG